MKEYGLDLSVHNGDLDFNTIKNNGNAFVILRAGYGTSTKDSRFDEYYEKAKKADLKVGAYWYSYALNVDGGKTEARKMLEVIKGKTFEYPLFIDMEDADQYKKKHGMPSNETLSEICNAFCEIVENAGYYVGVYASESWFNNQLKNVSKSYDKWVANWGTNNGTLQSDKSSVYNLHQYTSNYYLAGKRFDRNISYLDYGNIIKGAGLNGFVKTGDTTFTTATKETDIVVNSKVMIKSGAVYGGLSSARGKAVPSYVLEQIHTVSKIQTNKGVEEALLKEINSWVAVASLNLKAATTTSSPTLKVGSKVTIKAGASYYNGSSIPSWVMKLTWIVKQIDGDRVVIDKSSDGKHSIMSPINKKYLNVK